VALSVLKVGGSLASEPNKLRLLMVKLAELSKTHRLVAVPGGGDFADTVRKLDKQFSLDSKISHRMAILAMDQYGLLLSDLSANSSVVGTFEDAKNVVNSGKLPIFLPSQFMFKDDPLENSWEVTSDSIALYIAHKLQAEKVLFVTDVDGLYTANPKIQKSAALIKEISPRELSAKKVRTSVDSALPALLEKWPIPCYVVNGFYPERIASLLEGKAAVSTLISGKKL
jgi:5-(aminomethyl)-3-furanmethanol phosphate kinase